MRSHDDPEGRIGATTMTCPSEVDARDELHETAEKITDLTMLIQKFPAEARIILDAVEDGLTFGPAQVMDDTQSFQDAEDIEQYRQLLDQLDSPSAKADHSALLTAAFFEAVD